MSQDIHLSIDAMGGDQGPRLVVKAVHAFLKSHPHVSATLVGDLPLLNSLLPEGSVGDRLRYRHAETAVSMEQKAGRALRDGQSSSMWQAVELVAEGEAQACISGGNTGALMAMGRKLVGTFDGVRRPAICKPIPTPRGSSFLLDLGANIEVSPEQLVQFAIMGAALATVYGRQSPSIALLNIGTELSKGSDSIQLAAQQLQARDDVNFAGFIEGHNLFDGRVDVIVCDGLVGNVALKVSEGVANFVFSSLRHELEKTVLSRAVALLVKPLLSGWRKKFDPARYNGAAFLGLRKTLVKSHGGADQLGFEHALQTAVDQVQARIPEKIQDCLEGGNNR